MTLLHAQRETSTNYAVPHRPALLRMANAVGPRVKQVSLTFESLVRAAERKERVSFTGDLAFETPLKVLLAAVESEARLHWFGRFITRQRIVNLLRNRLRVQRLLQAHPEIVDVRLPAVLLVTGLQRTGTTKLHRLLAADPQNRALLSYEALNPAPLDVDRNKDVHRKRKQAHTAQKALRYLAPDFFAVHPVEADAPEEDVLLLDYACISTVAESTLHVPTYARWVEENDNRPAYRYMELLLKVLSWRQPEKRWELKSPHHLEFLDSFLDVFDGATVIMTHRDPLETLPSFCSMISHGHGLFSDVVDPCGIGDHWLRKTARMLNNGMAVRARRTDTRFVDVKYVDLLADAPGVVGNIYHDVGLSLSKEAHTRMTQVARINPQFKYGVHKYRMADFGLNQASITSAYDDYLTAYIDRSEVT